MDVTHNADGTFELLASRDELVALNNCMNEALQAVADFEFHARVGATRADVRALLHTVNSALSRRS